MSVLSPCNVCLPANEGIFGARRENYLSASKREFCKDIVLGLRARTGTPKPKQLCRQLEARQCIFSLIFRSCSLAWKFPFRFGTKKKKKRENWVLIFHELLQNALSCSRHGELRTRILERADRSANGALRQSTPCVHVFIH